MNNRNRKPNRLQNYDYSQEGYYFLTICTQNRMRYFGDINSGQMKLNRYGKIVRQCWLDLPNHYFNLSLDEWIIMPNHIHGILVIKNNKVGTNDGGVETGLKPVSTRRHGISEFIRGFKTFSSRRINETSPYELFRWQRSFYDHIIRDEESLDNIRMYIRNNPLKWALDTDNPDNF